MQEFISPNKLDKDLNQHVKKAELYSFALNATIESFSEENSLPFLGNVPSNILSSTLNVGEKVIAAKFINELNIVILFTKDSLYSYIKYFKVRKENPLEKKLEITSLKDIKQTDFTSIITVVSSNCLNFTEESNTYITYKLTSQTLNLYFVDNTNPDRFVYFDYDSESNLSLNDSFKNYTQVGDCNIVYDDSLNCNTILWNPLLSYPTLSLKVVPGGEKDKGVYSYLIAYSTELGTALTEYKSLTNPIPIYKESTGDNNNGIQISVSDITKDSIYRYYTIVAIKTIKGITSYYKVGTYPITQTSVMDTDVNVKDISFDEIFKTIVYYKSSKFISSQNNILFRAGLKEHERYNLQPIASKIKLKWFKTKLREGDYKNPNIASNFRGFLSDENYVFGLIFILDNQEELPVIVIPNREKTNFDVIPIYNKDTENIPTERWKVYNTATVEKTNPAVEYDIENPQVYQEGEFGYYESTERYPNIPEVWGDLCNQPIRLHKFPDVLVSNFHSTANTFEEDLFIYPLGVKLDDSVDLQLILKDAVKDGLISEEQRRRIKGYKLVRGNRVGNKSIIAKGLLYNVWSYTEDNEDCGEGSVSYFSSYPFNDSSDDDLISPNKEHYNYERFELDTQIPSKLEYSNTGRYTFHSPDTSFVEPALGSTLKIESEEYGVSRGIFRDSEDQAKYIILSKKHYNVAIMLGRWISYSIDDPDVQKVSGAAASIGQTAGGAVGSAFGPIGGAIGSLAGGIIGGLIGGNLAKQSLNHLMFQNSVLIAEAEKFLQMFQLFNKPVSLHKQYQAVGKYSNTEPVENEGNKIRKLETTAYLPPSRVVVPERDSTINFNNWNRENSVYLKVNENLPTLYRDNSRVKLVNSDVSVPVYSNRCFNWRIKFTSEQDNNFALAGTDCNGIGFFIGEFNNDDFEAVICAKEIFVAETINIFGHLAKVKLGDLNIIKEEACAEPTLVGYEKKNCECDSQEIESNVSSYYGSIKNNIINQYGTVYDINWLYVHSDMKPLHKCISDIIKPVNLIPISLSEEELSPARYNIITDIICEEEVNICDIPLKWDTTRTFRVCNPDGTTTHNVYAKDYGSHSVEFSLNYTPGSSNVTWHERPNGLFTFTTSSDGICHGLHIRVKGCTDNSKIIWGCNLAFTSEECKEESGGGEEGGGSINPCEVGVNQYRIQNNNSFPVRVTYEDGVYEEWQELLSPSSNIVVCRKSSGMVKYRRENGEIITSNMTVTDLGNCESCQLYLNSMGGFPEINPTTFEYTRRFDVRYNPVTKTITDHSTFDSGNKEYKIDEGQWFTGLNNYDVSAFVGREISVSVIYGSGRTMATNVSFLYIY